ncbi:MAG: long-chain-fatty-acid--CoA ligase [Chloroflexota bacterium]
MNPYAAKPWLQHYPLDVPHSIPYPDESIWDALEGIVARWGDRTASLFQNFAMSYARMRDLSADMSGALAIAGVRHGDRVLALLPNVPHFSITYFGTVRLGAAVTSAPPTSVPRELEYFIRDSGARTIVTLDLLYEKIADVWQPLGVELVVVGKATDFMPAWARLVAGVTGKVPEPAAPVPYGDQVVSMRSFLRGGHGYAVHAEVKPEDVAVLQYTGGTTGTPKAAMLTHRSLLANAHQMVAWFPELDMGDETILAVLPFFHVYGLTLGMNAGVLLAASIILIAGGWVPTEVFAAIERHRPTVFPGVPTLYVAVLHDERARRFNLSTIDISVSGGAPLPVEVKREFDALTGGHIFEGYGLTEASPVTHAQPYVESGREGSVGLPIPDTEAMIVDAETGEPVPVGDSGELLIKGPQVMAGYWNRPDETAETLRDGWLHTGDIARMDEDGFFYIVDRLKDLIITGGENIYPREVEEVLYEHPKIKEAAVVGVPHPFGGELAKAFVVLKPGAEAKKHEIREFVAERLAKHKVPRAIEFREQLPKALAGKVLKRQLAEEERQKAEKRQERRAVSRET